MASVLGGRGDKDRERRDELLSAYLDGELEERERQALESRLSRNPALRAELRAMHQTVLLMEELPQVAAPRNFILTDSMVAQARVQPREGRVRGRVWSGWTWAAPLLTAATTVVSLLFVVVLVGDIMLSGMGGMASAPAPAREQHEAPALALEAAPSREAEAEGEAEAESLDGPDLVSPPSQLADAEHKEGVEEPLVALEEAAGERATATAAPRVELEGESATEAMRAPETPAGAGGPPQPRDAREATEAIAAASAPTIAPTVGAVTPLTPTIPPQEPPVSDSELGPLEPTPEELETTPRLTREEPVPLEEERVPWRALEVALGISSLALVYATVQAWRRRD